MLDDSFVGIDKAFMRVDGIDNAIRPISIDEFMGIEVKWQEGTPEVLVVMPTREMIDCHPPGGYVNKQRVFLWPRPNDNEMVLHYQSVRRLEDYDRYWNISDSSSDWLESIIYGLAANLADEYAISISERNWLEAKANRFHNDARLGDIEKVETCFTAW